MGLQSALTTSLTGLQAAETVIDVVGNNVANSGTVGFKESDVLFANQFLQTQSIGSAPTAATGGTNPRQIGLGVKVSAINPDFTQGTIQISSNPLDVAIQGDGFLLVEGFQGEQLFTRNGQLQTNSQNEIVTATGNRILGLTVDEDFEIIPNLDAPVPLSIPLGVPVAQSTSAAFFTGNLTPNAVIGTNGVLTMQAMGDSTVEIPENASGTGGVFDAGEFQIVDAPVVNASTATAIAGGTLTSGTTYQYRLVWFANSGTGSYESPASVPLSATPAGANLSVRLDTLPVDVPATSIWDGRRVYRSSDGGTTFQQIGADLPVNGATFDDTGLVNGPRVLDDTTLEQEEYSYYVTFYNSLNTLESRPTSLVGPFSVDNANSRIRIDDLPQPTGVDDGFNKIRIYRNLGSAPTEFHLVDTIDVGATTYIDSTSDTDPTFLAAPLVDLLGPKATATTLLTDVVIRNGDTYIFPFVEGTLSFTGTKGGRTLAAKELAVRPTTVDAVGTNVADLRTFMDQTYGIDGSLTDGSGSALNTDGELVFTSNAGVANEVGADVGAFTMAPLVGQTLPVSIGFEQTVEAEGQGTTTTFVVFDSLGEPINVRLTTVRVASEPGTEGATYRWFATSEDNEPLGGSVETFLASEELVFDLNGNLIDPSDGLEQITIDHPASNPLQFNLDFNSVSGLAVTDSQGNPVSSMSLARQDGFPTGTLTSFTITESGLIRGVFSNGAERPLGQLLMAKFANTTGLQQLGNNTFAQGINSGEPLINLPGSEGLGTLTAGAVELSNTDIGQNLIELILASTQYRGGARVITTTQQLLEELLNLRR